MNLLICNCGKPLDGGHDHKTCGEPIEYVPEQELATLREQLSAAIARAEEEKQRASLAVANLTHADEKIAELQKYIGTEVHALEKRAEEAERDKATFQRRLETALETIAQMEQADAEPCQACTEARQRAEAAEERCDRLKAALEGLAGYASTVRMDRKDESREYALQTVDWCEGLMECVEEARKDLEPKP